MGYLIKNDVGETNFFDPTFSNLSANVSSMTQSASGFYYLLPALYPNVNSKLLMYSFCALITTTSTGNFAFSVTLPNNYKYSGSPIFIPFTCNSVNTNFNVLHLNAQQNVNPNILDCLVHSSNTITGNVLNFTVQLYVL
jgi:hypothetical protein